MEGLAAALQQLVQNGVRGAINVQGTISAVDESNYTCSVDMGDDTLFLAVPLRVMIGSAASVVEIPVVNTKCIMCFRDGNINFPQILSIDRAAKILIDTPLVQFNGGDKGGMVEVINLVTKLNNLENLVNDLITKYNTHTHVLALSSGTGTAAVTVTQETGSLTPTVRANIENELITQ